MLAARTLVRKIQGSLKQLKRKLTGKGRKEKSLRVQSAAIVAQQSTKLTTSISTNLELDSTPSASSITLNTSETLPALAEQQTASPQPANKLKEALVQLAQASPHIIEDQEEPEVLTTTTNTEDHLSTSSSLAAEDASSLALSYTTEEATSTGATTPNTAEFDSSAISSTSAAFHPSTELSSLNSPAELAPSTPSAELTVSERIAKGNRILQRIREILARQEEEAERKQCEEQELGEAEQSAASIEEEKSAECSSDDTTDESLVSSDEEEDFTDSISPAPSPPSSPEPESPSSFSPADTSCFSDSPNFTYRRRRTPTRATLDPALLALRADFGAVKPAVVDEEEKEDDFTLDPRFTSFSSLRKPRPTFRPAPRTLEKDDEFLRRQAVTERLRLKIAAERERQARGPVDEEEAVSDDEDDDFEEKEVVYERPASRMSSCEDDDE